MSLPILGANTLSSGFSVANSVRMNGDARMTITPSTADADRWTFSCWVKRSVISSGSQTLFSAIDPSNNLTELRFNSDDKIDYYSHDGSSYTGRLNTNRVFRDVAAWYHIVAVWDSANGTAGNRMRLYINGVEETSFATDTNPSSGQDSYVGANLPHYVGDKGDAGQYFKGYMAEVYYCNGQAYAASDFGEFDEDSPTIWKPKDASGLTFGTGGFYLDFEDSANLGNDANGGTDLTESGLAATDQASDSPTNNFCTMSPLWNFANDATLSEGNLKVVGGGAWNSAGATIGLTAGKWYYEVKMTTLPGGGSNGRTGFFDSEVNVSSGNIFAQTNGTTYYYNEDGGEMIKDNSATTNDYGVVAQGSILGVALNMDDKQVTFYDDNSAIVTNYALSSNIGTAIPSSSCYNETQEYNFGNPPYSLTSAASDENGYGSFEFAPPSGYYAICTKNLAEFG